MALNGVKVALLEGRMPGELASLVRRYGGDPYCVPAVYERALDAGKQVATFVDQIIQGHLPVVVCQTGAGVKTLFEETERLGRLTELLASLQERTVVCRGPKPSGVLRKHGVPIAISAASPYTTRELLEAMASLKLADIGVALLHYGERNRALAGALQNRGARVQELLVYEWLLPDDLQPLRQLIEDLIDRRVDAIAFTSQVQIRHLFQIASELGASVELAKTLHDEVVVASVGPVCTAALHEVGVSPDVAPENPKMGPMVAALAHYFEQDRPKEAEVPG